MSIPAPEYTLITPRVVQGHLNRSHFNSELDQVFIRRIVPRKIDAEHHLVLPMRIIQGADGLPGTLEIAMSKPADMRAQDYLVKILQDESQGLNVLVRHVPEDAVRRAIDFVFGLGGKLDQDDQDELEFADEGNRAEDESAILVDKPTDLVSIRKLRQCLREAINSRTTDLHLEATKNGGRVRMRQDGRLVDHLANIQSGDYGQMISWLKIQARKDIAEKRLPQDGGFYITNAKRRVDVRFSSIPTIFGEKVVLRFLDSESDDHPARKGLGALINRPAYLGMLETALNTPEGIILVTGPTGSGKTTTLFGCLNYLRNKYGTEYNITTVEDPVEYRVEGVNHVEVKPEIGFTFASSLRSIVRQDPDFLMIGEIRDQATAEIAMQSALTGHLVLSTLHTNNALGAIPRLLDLGARPFMLASTIILLQAQRLIRRLCPSCGQRQTLTEDQVRDRLVKGGVLHRIDELVAGPVYKPFQEGDVRGCEVCENSGFKGRIAVMELLPVTPKIKELIENQASQIEMTKYATRQGFRLLVEDGLDCVKEGLTSLEEAIELAPSSYEQDALTQDDLTVGPATIVVNKASTANAIFEKPPARSSRPARSGKAITLD